jgi:hypothetical protein
MLTQWNPQSPLVAVCLVSTGSWPDVMTGSDPKSWYIRACWFSGIVFALFSVLTAAQQSLRLHRLSAHRDGLHYIRLCLMRDRKPLDSEDGEIKLVPRPLQVWAWQSAMMFLILAVVCLIAGMMILIWDGATNGEDAFLGSENGNVSLVFCAAMRGWADEVAVGSSVYDRSGALYFGVPRNAGLDDGWCEYRVSHRCSLDSFAFRHARIEHSASVPGNGFPELVKLAELVALRHCPGVPVGLGPYQDFE